MGGSASMALTFGGIISFILNLIGFLPLLLNKVDSVFGEQLKNWLLSLVARIPWESAAGLLTTMLSAVPTTWLLGFLMWVMMALLMAGLFAMMKGLKGILVGGLIAALLILYVTGQLGWMT